MFLVDVFNNHNHSQWAHPHQVSWAYALYFRVLEVLDITSVGGVALRASSCVSKPRRLRRLPTARSTHDRMLNRRRDQLSRHIVPESLGCHIRDMPQHSIHKSRRGSVRGARDA